MGKIKRQQSMETLLQTLGGPAPTGNQNEDLKNVKLSSAFLMEDEEDIVAQKDTLGSKDNFRDITVLAMERKRISAEVVAGVPGRIF